MRWVLPLTTGVVGVALLGCAGLIGYRGPVDEFPIDLAGGKVRVIDIGLRPDDGALDEMIRAQIDALAGCARAEELGCGYQILRIESGTRVGGVVVKVYADSLEAPGLEACVVSALEAVPPPEGVSSFAETMAVGFSPQKKLLDRCGRAPYDVISKWMGEPL